MTLVPVSDTEVIGKSKKVKTDKPIKGVTAKVVPKEEQKQEVKVETDSNIKSEIKGEIKNVEQSESVRSSEGTSLIVKKIYFPGNLYSQNKDKFKKVLTEFGLSWAKSAMRTHTNKEGKQMMSGIYYSPDQVHKILCIYEGTDKPATFFYKTTGSGGLFLLNLIQFCTVLGCVIEDKNEEYMQKVVMQLDGYGDINVEEKKVYAQLSDFEKKAFDEKVKKAIDEILARYTVDCEEYFKRRGISMETALFFKRKDLEQSVPWAIEHGFIKI